VKRILSAVVASFMVALALFGVNIGAVQAEELPYTFTVSETLGQEKGTITFYNFVTDEVEVYELEFTLVPEGATLTFTPEIDFAATMMFYAVDEEDGNYYPAPAFWEVEESEDLLNYVQAGTTAVFTFESLEDFFPGSFYALDIWEEGYERTIYFKVVPGENGESAEQPQEDNEDTAPVEQETPAPAAEVNAKPTSAKVLVNGQEVEFTAYNINGNNYFKLRDIAMAVNGSEKQFEVTWDAENNAILLISGSAYTPVGGELEVASGLKPTIGKLTTSTIYKDGQEIYLTAYKIGGNNYFKLHDIAEAFNIGVAWDAQTKTISIDTASDYIPE